MGKKKLPAEQQEKMKHKVFWHEKYSDYYKEKPPFAIEDYKGLGRVHIFAELIIYALFALFLIWGAWNLKTISDFIRSNYSVQIQEGAQLYEPYIDAVRGYTAEFALTIVIIFFISLGLGYLVVLIFSKLAVFIMYFTVFVQIGLFGYLYWKVDWEYSWVFLIPLALNVLFLTIWAEKFKRAVKFLKQSCEAVTKERTLLLPYFTQTILIMLLSFFYFVIIIGYFFNIAQFDDKTYSIASRTLTINGMTVFIFFTLLFVFLTYVVYNTTKAMKIFIIHAWYRGGHWGFWRSYNGVRFRFFGIFTFSLLATVAHSFKFIKQITSGSWGVRTPAEAKKLMEKVRPVDMETMNKEEQKKMSIWDKIFYYINYYTLYAVVIENKPYWRATFRSMHLTLKNIPDLYVKKSHVNIVFRLMEYSMSLTNAIVGAVIGAAIAHYFGLNYKYGAAAGTAIFLWIGGSTSTLILNDLNLSYKTIMYIHTIDDLYGKEGYTRWDLVNPLSDQEMKDLEEEHQEKVEKKEKRLAKREGKDEDEQSEGDGDNQSSESPEIETSK